HDIQHEDRPAAVLLRQPAEGECSQRPAGGGEKDAFPHGFHIGLELAADRLEREDEYEEGERTERPAAEGSEIGVQLRTGERPKVAEHGQPLYEGCEGS